MFESNQLLFLAAAAIGITLLSSIFVIVAGARKVREQLSELDALKGYVEAVQSKLVEIGRSGERSSTSVQGLAGIGLHFRQIRREQARVSDTLKMISSAIETLASVLQQRDDIKREQGEEIKEAAEASRSLREWKSRVAVVFADADRLFESEAVREFIDGVAPPPEEERRPTRKGFASHLADHSAASRVRASGGEVMAQVGDDSKVGSKRS